MEALRKDYRYTYLDYAGWEAGERYELIDGMPYIIKDILISAAEEVFARTV